MFPSPIIVLGMHRSGTSCLAGCLEEAGLYLGDVVRRAPHNAKGNRENPGIMHLHDALLLENGGAWDDPPTSQIRWATEHKARRDRLIAAYPTGGTWGFKDPRTLLVLDGWIEALPGARLVGSFRHPLAVAQSLYKRNKFPIKRGLALWLAYNQSLLEAVAERGVELICFDRSPERYDRALHTLAARLDLVPPAAGFSFFETALRHNDADDRTELPAPVVSVYRSLLARTPS